MSCPNCGFVAEPFKKWGYLDGPVHWDYCEHYLAARDCRSCSQLWWKPDFEYAWDEGGCPRVDCPDCLSTIEAMEE